ncbi:MAG: HAD family phosphatase [Proteobacteria bacterium]|nr:HAD family phosphatase [Pseudomonadota bacterium]
MSKVMAEAALLFDLDGTMLMTDPIHMGVFADLLGPRGFTVDEAFYMKHIHGRLNLDFFAEFLPDEPDPEGLSDLKEFEFRRRLPRPYPAMPGVMAALQDAQSHGWALGVVTNAKRDNAEAMLEAIGARHFFDVIVSGEECEKGKPHPAPYREALRLVDIPAHRAIAFEDSPAGVRSAAAAGIVTVGIRSSLDDAALRASGADMTIQDFTDPALGPILQRLTGVDA